MTNTTYLVALIQRTDETATLSVELPHTPLVVKALRSAHRKHAGKYRRISKEPYINHPIRVALLLTSHNTDESVVAAALLHDVLEIENDQESSSPITDQELESEFGKEIADIILYCRSSTQIFQN